MTLIPLISAIVATPEAMTAPVGPAAPRKRSGYDPGARHRPLAAAIAIGLPAGLVVAVALSPMVVEPAPRTKPITGTLIELPKPPPEPEPQPATTPRQVTPAVTTVPTPLPPVAQVPPVVMAPEPYVLPSGTGSGPVIVDPPAPPQPRLVIAEIDGRYAGAFQPEYPPSEQRRGIEGVAKVRVLIGTDGRVKAVELVSTDSPGFFEETRRRALAKWRFKPATRGGVAEESWKVMTVRFQIRSG
ncbi:TonB family protein [Sphingopyxis sp. XHP0097]|uniref:Protein TonB n=1 Tax=Sphingopyxis jiangsuensis TaxID=2871171 RepID=A0ABS7MEK7_9SPHN|nr:MULTISPECIES: energy transducer TonB [Sphingopyxis]MBL0769452.1 TonB family protein [Sphingopyxis lutea]MBY4637440.1 TonB family protein [Sphingopyxis jiangsuensis]